MVERTQRHAESLAELMLDRAPAWTRPLVRDLELGIHGFEGEEDRRLPFGDDDLPRLAVFPNLEWLDLTMTSVRDLSGISRLKSLRHLVLDDTLVEDLAPLSALENLQSLSLTGTAVRDLSPLGQLPRLQELELRETWYLQGLDGLAGAPALRYLNLFFSEVSDLEALATIPTLEEVNLGFKDFDLAPLQGLPRLQALVDISGNSDLAPLAGSGLRRLQGHLDGSQLPLLATMSKLEQLHVNVAGAGQDGLHALARLRRLRELQLVWRGAATLEFVSGMQQLETLRLISMHLPDLLPLNGLLRLQEFTLLDGRLERIGTLRDMPSLRGLVVLASGLASLNGLGGARGLRVLVLDNNPFDDLDEVRHLPFLEELRLAGTGVEDLASLRGMRRLRLLDIVRTPVRDISPLLALEALQELRCDAGQLDPGVLSRLDRLKALFVAGQGCYMGQERIRKFIDEGKPPPGP